MSALAFLTERERTEVQADLDETIRVRSEYRIRLRTLRESGRATLSQVDQLDASIEACSRGVARMRALLGETA